MSLFSTIQDDIKNAMRAKDQRKLATLRSILAAFKNAQVAGTGEPTEEDYMSIVKKQAKQRKESIKQFEEGGREDLAAVEKEELALIETYLPAQLSKEEITAKVTALKTSMGIEDRSQMGQLMGAAMKELGSEADGAVVKDVVTALLQ